LENYGINPIWNICLLLPELIARRVRKVFTQRTRRFMVKLIFSASFALCLADFARELIWAAIIHAEQAEILRGVIKGFRVKFELFSSRFAVFFPAFARTPGMGLPPHRQTKNHFFTLAFNALCLKNNGIHTIRNNRLRLP
jgi:hypothetical protein